VGLAAGGLRARALGLPAPCVSSLAAHERTAEPLADQLAADVALEIRRQPRHVFKREGRTARRRRSRRSRRRRRRGGGKSGQR